MTAMPGAAPIFVVGCPRSGTTLVHSILGGHPRIAIANEISLIAALTPRRSRPWTRAPTVDDVVTHWRFDRLALDPDIARDAVRDADPASYGALIDTVMKAWATSLGKQRWGEKNPGYLGAVPLLERQFPDAQFVHVVRDGREVAAALAERSWGPPNPVAGACWWRFLVGKRGRAARRLGPHRYFELRLERLTADPERELRRLCEFLGEEYSPEMLRYPERHPGRGLREGHAHLAKPPTPGLRDWTAGLSTLQQRAVESVCRPLLRDLTLPVRRRSFAAWLYAWWFGLREVGRILPTSVGNRVHPRRRRY